MKRAKSAGYRDQQGFSFLELVIVVVIVGILAAMSLPKFGSLGPSAANANAESVAGAIGAAAASYNARCEVGLETACSGLTCSAAMGLLSGIDAADYTLGGSPGNGCTVLHTKGDTTYTSAPIQ
ncbi:MAG: prepilin-type N-terminal cleavage/methylation domain-containing protein [Magnetococcales bacterium]|nr:prepilin-type N-terminal cleavage/methylation domain-containing protein [Magnetococcales bacterium]